MFVDLGQIFSIRKAWKQVRSDTDTFLVENKSIFDKVRIGGTFIPENLTHEGLTNSEVLDCLKYIVEDLGVRNLRLGLRLNKIDLENENLGLYDDILSYCFLHRVNLTLNLGPIKYCGWPEYHLSDTIKNSVGILPKNKSSIGSVADISCVSLNELENLLILLEKKYTVEQLQNIVALQPENEGFNPFGEYKWIFEHDHITKAISIFDFYLPGRDILFNSAGFFDLDSIVDYIRHRSDAKRFIVGLDYYYTFDKFDHLKFYEWFDLFVFSWKLKNFGLSKFKKYQSICGFRTEVTEAQMEPWGRADKPGNSVESLKFVLLRSSQFLYNYNGNINMYGLDRFAIHAVKNKQTPEQAGMARLIKNIQSKSSYS
jgi:hypothetical protein